MLHIYRTNIHQIRDELQSTTAWLEKQSWLHNKQRSFLKAQIKAVMRQLKGLSRCKSGPRTSKLYFSKAKPITGGKLKHLQFYIMRSQAFHLVGALAVFMRTEQKAKRQSQKVYSRPKSLKHLHSIAEIAKKSTNLIDPIAMEGKVKPDGSNRIICKFDVTAKTQSKVAEWVFLACSPPNQFEYCKANSSTHKAVSELPDHINNDFRYWIVFDFKNAFHSVRRGHLLSVANIVPIVSKRLLYKVNDQTLNEAAQPSLPQGIASSPKIMSAVVGQHLRHLDASKLVIMSYSDDMLIGARTMGEAKNAVQTLHQVCENSSAGPLRFKGGVPKIIDLGAGGVINFLGYATSLNPHDGNVRCSPSTMAFSKFYRNLAVELHKLHVSGSPQNKLLDEAHKYGEKWRSAFSLWTLNDARIELFAACVEIFFTDFAEVQFNIKFAPEPPKAESGCNQSAPNGPKIAIL